MEAKPSPPFPRCCLPPGDVQFPFLSQLIIKQVVFVSLIPTLGVRHPSGMRYSAPKTAFLSPRACCESDLDSQPHSDFYLDLNFQLRLPTSASSLGFYFGLTSASNLG